MKIRVAFGALVDPLYKQLRLPRRRLRYLQDAANSIATLDVGGLLAPSEVQRARRRLMKRILVTFPELKG